ncbi:MAG: hypothetical protein R3Y11_06015 [Pseudomonadota bacterium]
MPSYSRLACLVLSASVAFACGCGQTGHETWKETKVYYREYLNTPAAVDYHIPGCDGEEELLMAQSFVGMDRQLYMLERSLDGVGRPSQELVEGFLRQFPWLAGIAGVAAEGQIVAQFPEVTMKPMEYTALIEQDPKQHMRDVRATVLDTPLGPEVVIAAPIYDSTTFVGLFATHFDMRALLAYAKAPQDIVILSTDHVLWAGRFDIDSTPLLDVDWTTILRTSTGGRLSNENGEFFWMARFIGHTPLVFAVPVEGNFDEKPEQLAILGSLDSLGSGFAPMYQPVMTDTRLTDSITKDRTSPSGNFILE